MNAFKCSYSYIICPTDSQFENSLVVYMTLIFHSRWRKLTRKTGLPEQRCYRVHKILTGRAEIKAWFFFKKQFHQNQHGNKSSSKCPRHVKHTTDSKLPFSVLCIGGCKIYPLYAMLSWHPRQSKPLYSISLYFLVVQTNQPVNDFTS